MSLVSLPVEFSKKLLTIIDQEYVLSDNESLLHYGQDQTENLNFPPQIIVRPRTPEEISKILVLCNQYLVPVTPRGAGTGLSGAALPHLGGVVISMERMNSIIAIDEQNLQVITEPGVITEVLQNTVKEKGLYYPPDPASKGSCFIGGNVSHNSGGPRAVKYGVVRDYVLNLEVVLATGEIIWTGSNVLKNSTGYNLTQLIVGSEGTLGIVTKIVLKLIPLPKYDLLMLVPFRSLEKAGAAVSAIFKAGFTPSALELIEVNALKITSEFMGSSAIPVTDDTEAHLIIEVDGNHLDTLMIEMESISEIVAGFDCGEVYFADDAQQKNELWKLRRKVAEAVKIAGYTIEEDTVVPRALLPELIRGVKELAVKKDFSVACYGHAGDGNLHIRVNIPGKVNSYADPLVTAILRDLFKVVHELGGTISGEHGIGLIQKGYLDIVLDQTRISIMKGIKKIFDPNNILNAGKIFD